MSSMTIFTALLTMS